MERRKLVKLFSGSCIAGEFVLTDPAAVPHEQWTCATLSQANSPGIALFDCVTLTADGRLHVAAPLATAWEDDYNKVARWLKGGDLRGLGIRCHGHRAATAFSVNVRRITACRFTSHYTKVADVPPEFPWRPIRSKIVPDQDTVSWYDLSFTVRP